MLNVELLRREPERTRAILARRDEDAAKAFDTAVAADEVWRRVNAEVEALRAERKQRSAELRGAPTDAQRAELRTLGDRLAERETALQVASAERQKAMAWVPNLVDPSVPLGKDDSENEVLRIWGEPRTFDFEPLDHVALADRLGILDLPAGATFADARLSTSCSTCTSTSRAIPRCTRPTWSKRRSCTAPANCRSSATICSTMPKTTSGSSRPLRCRWSTCTTTRSCPRARCR